ncbi:MAG: hypothetical protein GX067_01380 [Clostridiales bacterium]|nr:hypothetical protein [Clostridiales bacterium]
MVMKGCQKRIIVMKNTGSNLFDEAYFILKDSAVRSPSISEQDMVGEAARIIAENMIVSERRDTKPRRRSGAPELYMLLRWYVAGVITAALICIAIVLFL